MEEKRDKRPPTLPKGLVVPYIVFTRVFNALTIKTFFQADEYWQSLEPAHNFVFGYGYLTWEWKLGLRSVVHPLIFAACYKLLALVGLDDDFSVVVAPKVLQGLIASAGDYYIYKFIKSYTSNEMVARWGVLLSLVSSFNWFMLTRTFSNSLEYTLVAIALSYWPWNRDKISWPNYLTSLLFAGLSIVIKPTNFFIWIVLFAMTISSKNWLKLVFNSVLMAALVLVISVSVDYYYYGGFIIPIINFIQFNLGSNLSKFYGSSPWHFHLFQSLPVILTTYLPFTLFGLYKYPKKNLKFVLLINILLLSCIDHKEFRFLYPLKPIMLLYTAYTFNEFYLKFKSFKKIISLIILANLALSYFFTQVNESGVIEVIEYLKTDPDVESIGFLTPCHSTPWQAYLHNQELDDKIWFLTCEPPLFLLNSENATVEIDSYLDESDVFYLNPVEFLYKNFPPPFNKELVSPGKKYKYSWPTHLVIFEDLEPVMSEYLKDSPYEECHRVFNSYFHWDSRRNGDVIVYCKWPWE